MILLSCKDKIKLESGKVTMRQNYDCKPKIDSESN